MPIPTEEWNHIIDRVADEYCVPFLGAGASLGSGLPSAGELAEEIAAKCDYPGEDKRDFLRVCQYYAMVTDKAAPRQFIAKRLRTPGNQPGIVHTTLASLPFPFILTTNFDDLMERALKENGKAPETISYRVGGNKIEIGARNNVNRPLVYKLHGSIDDPYSMITTEDDIVEFMASVLLGEPPLPHAIKQLFTEYSVLFIGYGLKDWNIRVLLRALRGRSSDISCFSVQKRPSNDALAKEWDKTVLHLRKGELRCYDIDAVEFVTELKQRYVTRGVRV